VKLFHNAFKNVSDELIVLNDKITILVNEELQKQLHSMDKQFSKPLYQWLPIMIEMDISTTIAKLATEKHYIKPIIQDNDTNTIEAIQLRHAVIEHKDKSIFVPNNVFIGDYDTFHHKDKWYGDNPFEKVNGFLLFGLNSAGKSTQMKQIGQAIIMAQAGFYVPADYFSFTIYHSLFTRILGNDNISRGLSSFAVEMIELNNILKRMNQKSLILGDEICKGTEYYSALSIVANALKKINTTKACYIFATHLHELTSLSMVQGIKELLFLNMKVIYDKETKTLLYQRKLELGSGESSYGLEFTESIIQDNSFLKDCYQLRGELLKETNEMNNIINKTSKYSKHKVKSNICALCDKPAIDIEEHHIVKQETANENGLIKHFHKNNSWNIIPLCKKHHQFLHDNENILEEGDEMFKYVMTSKGLKLIMNQKLKELLEKEQNV